MPSYVCSLPLRDPSLAVAGAVARHRGLHVLVLPQECRSRRGRATQREEHRSAVGRLLKLVRLSRSSARFADFDKPDRPKSCRRSRDGGLVSRPAAIPHQVPLGAGPGRTGLPGISARSRSVQPGQAGTGDFQQRATLGLLGQPDPADELLEFGHRRTRGARITGKGIANGRAGIPHHHGSGGRAESFNARDLQDRREDFLVSGCSSGDDTPSTLSPCCSPMQAIREWRGRQVAGGPASLWNINSTGAVNQLFPTGAQLVVTGQPDGDRPGQRQMTTSVSNFTLQATQPLLQGGGWVVTLEPLTQAERTGVRGPVLRSVPRELLMDLSRWERIRSIASFVSWAYASRHHPEPQLAESGIFAHSLAEAIVVRNDRENLALLWPIISRGTRNLRDGDVSELQVDKVESSTPVTAKQAQWRTS